MVLLFASGQALADMTVDPAALQAPPRSVTGPSLGALRGAAAAGEQAGSVIDGSPEQPMPGAVPGGAGGKQAPGVAVPGGAQTGGQGVVPAPRSSGKAGALSIESDCDGFLPCLAKAGIAIFMMPFVSTITGFAIGSSLGETGAGAVGSFVGKGAGAVLGLALGLFLMPFAVGFNLLKAVGLFKKKPEETK